MSEPDPEEAILSAAQLDDLLKEDYVALVENVALLLNVLADRKPEYQIEELLNTFAMNVRYTAKLHHNITKH